MAKSKDKDFKKLVDEMFGRLGEMSPELLDNVLNGLQKRKDGDGFEVLDELRDFESNLHEKATIEAYDIDLPKYVDFWERYEDMYPNEDYERFINSCNKKNKTTLAKDINTFLDSIPAYYEDDYSLISHQIWFIGAVIAKRNLENCLVPLMDVLRCEDIVIQDLFMDDETGSINMYAELCHGHLTELYNIAIDKRVMPYARGVAIGALAKSSVYSPKDTLLIINSLRQIIEYYAAEAKTDRKVSVALIRATALIAANMKFEGLMPLISETYRKLRISAKGLGALSRVERLLDDKDVSLTQKESVVEHIEGFLSFQQMLGNPYAEDGDDDDEYDDYEDDDYDYEDDEDDDFFAKQQARIKKEQYTLDQIRRTNIINGKVRILGKDFINAHPKGISTATDQDYVKFANGIVERITGLIHDLSNDDIASIALKCALYFEDVIADAGIWRSFVETMRKMYGKPLPFFAVDEANYYTDEPNLEDVRLLVWLARQDSHPIGIANPMNEALHKVADAIYRYMEEMFETMPINEALADYFHDVKFMTDFYEARDAVKWAYLSSYVSCTAKGQREMIDVANEYSQIYGPQAFYQAESTLIYTNRIGPLGLYAKEWLAMILESNGKSHEAQLIRDMDGKLSSFHIKDRQADLFGRYTIERSDGLLIDMSEKEFKDLCNTEHSINYFYCCLVQFNGQWHVSGLSSWDDHFEELFEEEREKKKMMDKAGCPKYNTLVKKNGGSPLFYFKDKDAVINFVKKDMGVKMQNVDIPMFNTNTSNWLLFLPSENGRVLYVPEAATYVCDPRNPYFNEDKAKKDYLSLPLSIPYVLATYLEEHNMMPYAGFNSIEGDEAGRQLLHDNFDFVLRYLSSDNM